MALSSALAQEGVSRVSSYISTKIDDKACRAHNMVKLQVALSRLEFFLDKVRKMPITSVPLLRIQNILMSAYNDGVHLLNKNKLQGHEETDGQVVVRRRRKSNSSYFQWIIARAATASLSVSSLFGFVNKEHYLSTSDVQQLEWYVDCAEKFVADVESSCPLRRDITFPCPFIRQLLEGKTIRYQRMEASQELWFDIEPVAWEGHGVEAYISYKYYFERQDKNLGFGMMLRLSESTDIVGIAINCLRSSASLLNLMAEDATGQLPLLHNLQDISASYDPPRLGFPELHDFLARLLRPDPVCCHANEHNPGAKDIISSELSHIFPEQVSFFRLECYLPAAEYSSPRASVKPGRVRNLMMIDRPPPLKLSLSIMPHSSFNSEQEGCYISKKMGSNEARSPYGSIQQTIDTVRSEAIDCLTRQPDVKTCEASWRPNHGHARFEVEKTITAGTSTTVPKGRGSRYNTRSGAKRKRSKQP